MAEGTATGVPARAAAVGLLNAVLGEGRMLAELPEPDLPPSDRARALRLAPICWRQQNFIKDDEGCVATWLEPGKRGKFGPGEAVFFEMLAIVEGLSEPVVFSTKSIKAAMAFLANILPDYRKVRDAIKAERGGRAVPPWWF